MATGQPQSYGSIREFLDNLPNQPCIWQPENPNICVTCLRINEPIARVCSVWAQALDEAPLEEIDFEELSRVKYPNVVYKFTILNCQNLKKADFLGKYFILVLEKNEA